jgi:uncharacterized membrane protein YidH (DUF202 family)
MQEVVGSVLMVIGMVLIMLCNAIWYQAKCALQRKGYPMNLFFNHFRDFKMIDKAVSEETDPKELDRLRRIQKRMKAIWIIFPVAAVVSFLGAFLGPMQQ